MEYLKLYLAIAAVLVQQALSHPGFSLFHPLHHGPPALPVVQHNGFLADTHEVAAAKSAHLAAVAAHAHHEYPVHHHEEPVHHHEEPVYHHEEPVYHHEEPVYHHEEPIHHHEESVYHHEEPVHHHQYPIHHHELPVHHGEHSVHLGSSGHEHTQKYHGPIAVPTVLHNGHLADTPEVALAKSHHLGAVAQAKADKYYSGHQEYGYGGSYGYSGSHHGYGIPVVLPNGHIADTHEVAAAKSAHLLAVAKAKADKYYSGYGEGYGYGGAYGYSSSHHGYGIPVVLPNGHLADTHEVAAAKAAHLSAVAHAKAEQAHSHYHHDEHQHHEPLSYYVPHHSSHHIPQVAYIEPTAHHASHHHPQSFAYIPY